MKRNTFLIIVILSAIALAGVVFIQFFWIRNALQLQEDQFDNKVKLALKGVVNDLYECKNDTCTFRRLCMGECANIHGFEPENISRTLLDSLVATEFSSMNLDQPYIYGIFHHKSREVIIISDTLYSRQLVDSQHRSSLSCIYSCNDYFLGAIFPMEHTIALRNILWWLILCFLLIGMLVFGFSFTIHSFLKQKRLSEMKSDFVNNMTHEFKTPIATISLASEMLKKPAVLASQPKATKYASIIYDENQRLKNQVDHVLQIAVLDKQEYSLKKEDFDLHEMIHQVADNFTIIIKDRKGKLDILTDAINPVITADKMHIRNILLNLLDNANKYSPQAPLITVVTRNVTDGIMLSVEDQGIGISHENQKHIFRKLYRIHTGDVHDVKGFGLGLYYVKIMAEAHGGHVKVKSEPGKGSRFDVFLPIEAPIKNH